MIEFSGHGILLDIEGTTSSVSFVYDVMFPFARRELESYLLANWHAPDLRAACHLIARDAGHASLDEWCGEDPAEEHRRQLIRDESIRLMAGDAKATGLKQLQGLIWRSGFESGELEAHVYDDVRPALEAWNGAGRHVRIYSSGSIGGQRLFFAHTVCGNMLDLLQGHYDTTTGPKTQAASYVTIAGDFGLSPPDILFLSDVPAELDAARAAGLQTALCKRPGNADVSSDHGHPEICDFGQVKLR